MIITVLSNLPFNSTKLHSHSLCFLPLFRLSIACSILSVVHRKVPVSLIQVIHLQFPLQLHCTQVIVACCTYITAPKTYLASYFPDIIPFLSNNRNFKSSQYPCKCNIVILNTVTHKTVSCT